MLCEKHGIIFVHIPKAAGQSIELFFLQRLGLTWDQRAPLLLRANSDPAKGPDRLAHLTAAEYVTCGYVSSERFDSLFKFAFVRNPFDRLVSEYFYRNHHLRFSFRDFVLKHFPTPSKKDPYRHVMPQWCYVYNDEERLLVDFIGKTENANEDFKRICDSIGVDHAPLPRTNRSSRTGSVKEHIKYWIGRRREPARRSYQSYYDAQTREIIEDLYRRDLELFGYRF